MGQKGEDGLGDKEKKEAEATVNSQGQRNTQEGPNWTWGHKKCSGPNRETSTKGSSRKRG